MSPSRRERITRILKSTGRVRPESISKSLFFPARPVVRSWTPPARWSAWPSRRRVLGRSQADDPGRDAVDVSDPPGLVLSHHPRLQGSRRSLPSRYHSGPTPDTGEKLPEGLSVDVTVNYQFREPHTFKAQPAGDGVFQAKFIPVPQDPVRNVSLSVWDGQRFRYEAIVKDEQVSVGNKKFLLSELRYLFPAQRRASKPGRARWRPR